MRTCRRSRAPSSEWVLDGGGGMTPGDAATIAVALEPSHPIWFDEPTAVTSPDALAKIVDESVMPIGLGRNITDLAAFQTRWRAARSTSYGRTWL
ncbi:MAG: enolase C-terminal domain-like protein [Bryobacteraceae bacterium]